MCMWVRLFKTNRKETHAVVQVPKVMNSFINDLWILKKVHCLHSYEHRFQLLETMKKATFEHKVDRIIIPLRNPYDRFWDGITVAGRDSMLEIKEENAKIVCKWLAELVVSDPNTQIPGPTDHFMPYLDDDFVDWVTKGDVVYTTIDIDVGPDYLLYWDYHHGVDDPPVSNKSSSERVQFREHLIDYGSSAFPDKYKKFFEPINENIKRLRNGSTPLL